MSLETSKRAKIFILFFGTIRRNGGFLRATFSLGAEPHILQRLLSIYQREPIALVSNSPPQNPRARLAVLLTATQLFSDQLLEMRLTTHSLDDHFHLNDTTLSLTPDPVRLVEIVHAVSDYQLLTK